MAKPFSLISLCLLVFTSACLALSSEKLNECQLDQINALEPDHRVESEAGRIESWNSRHPELRCAGVAVLRRTIEPNGLHLPSYTPAPHLIMIVQGRGALGMSIPGCAETFQEPESQSRQTRQRSRQQRDSHHKIRHFRQGDIIAIPPGVPYWTFNYGNESLIAISLLDTSNQAHQLDSTPRVFYIGGNPELEFPETQRQQHSPPRGRKHGQHQEEDDEESGSVLSGFSSQFIAQALNTDEETARQLKNSDRPQIVKVKGGLSDVISPEWEQEEEEDEDEQGRHQSRGGRGRKQREDEDDDEEERRIRGRHQSRREREEDEDEEQSKPGRRREREREREDDEDDEEGRGRRERKDQRGRRGREEDEDEDEEEERGQKSRERGRRGSREEDEDEDEDEEGRGGRRERESHRGRRGRGEEEDEDEEEERGKGRGHREREGRRGSRGREEDEDEDEDEERGQKSRERGRRGSREEDEDEDEDEEGRGGRRERESHRGRRGRGDEEDEDEEEERGQGRGRREREGRRGSRGRAEEEDEDEEEEERGQKSRGRQSRESREEEDEEERGERGSSGSRRRWWRKSESRRHSEEGGRCGNGLEETLCSLKIMENIARPSRANYYNPRAGRIATLNSLTLPILRYFRLSAQYVVLYKNAIYTPHWNINANSILYVTRGRGRVRVVNCQGNHVFNGELNKGQLLVVPQNFVVAEEARDEGFEYVVFKTNDRASTNSLKQVFRGLPNEVLANVFGLRQHQVSDLKYNGNRGPLVNPDSQNQPRQLPA